MQLATPLPLGSRTTSMAESLSNESVEKAVSAINFLSSLNLPQRGEPSTVQGSGEASGQINVQVGHSGEKSGVVHAADKAIDALQRMRAGIKADRNKKRPIKNEISTLFRGKKAARVDKKPVWKHKFFCLSYKDQERIPTSEYDKEELFQADLGEKEVEFHALDLSDKQFKEVLLSYFPRLCRGGGYQLLKGLPNSRKLEVLPSVVYSSPAALKQRVGNSRTYIRPIQRDLDLEPKGDTAETEPTEKCLTCGTQYPISELQLHATRCEEALEQLRDEDAKRDLQRKENKTPPAIDLTSQDSSDSDLDVVEGAMVGHAIENSLTMSEATLGMSSKFSGSPLQVVIKKAQQTYLSTISMMSLEVRRSYLLADAMREAQKGKFDPSKMAKINFVGEGSVDYGGPRREFFRLLALNAKEMWFVGSSDKKFFANNVLGVQAQNFYNLGRFCSMSICQGGNGFPFFAKQVYQYFVSGKCTGVEIDTLDVPDYTLQFILQKIDDAENDDDIKVIFNVDEASEVLFATGFRKAVCSLGVADKPVLKSSLIDYHCLLKVKAEMDQFADGLSSLGVLDAVKKQPDVMKPLFVAQKCNLSADQFKDMLNVKYPDVSSGSVKERAQQTWIHFADFLDFCDEGKSGCTLDEVLVFFTGTDRVPPLGFSKPLTVSFLVDEKEMFATASTCDLQLRLPTRYSDYNAFADAMVLSLKGNDGFGGV